MALGDANTRLAPINPSALIGQATPVVEPRAVAALSDALRSGIITADDIMKRTGQAAQLREKAEIQLLQEQTSPESVAARAQAREAAMAQSALQGATATAQRPLVEPTAALAATALEEQAATQKYGPGVEYFKTLAPEAGIPAPVTPEGMPDYGKRAQLGLQLFEWKQTKERAKERLTPTHWEKSPDGTQLFKFNKQGELITRELEQSLATQAVSNFSQMQPGTTATAPATPATAVPPAATTPAPTPAQRAAAVEQFGVAPEQAAVMTGTDMSALVQPKSQPVVQPAATTAPAAPMVAGATTFLGPAQAKERADKILPSEGVTAMAKLRQANGIADRLAARYTDLVNSEPNLVGFIQGRVATWAKSKEWNEKVAAFERDANAILNPVARGILGETGVLSDKDVERYKGILPTLRDSPKIGNQKIVDITNDINRSIVGTVDTWKSAGYDVSGFAELAQKASAASPAQPAAATQPGASGGVQTLSTGRRIIRDANGIFRLVQ